MSLPQGKPLGFTPEGLIFFVNSKNTNVCFGSFADICVHNPFCPLSATSGHLVFWKAQKALRWR
jgi:hypothetical protein